MPKKHMKLLLALPYGTWLDWNSDHVDMRLPEGWCWTPRDSGGPDFGGIVYLRGLPVWRAKRQ